MHIEYSPQTSSYKKKLKKLIPKFAESKIKISNLNFTKLPWTNADFGKLPSGKKYSLILVVGIGGSSLGLKALFEALGGRRIIFLDNIAPDFVYERLKGIAPKKTLFILISKSGETIETISLAKLLLAKFPEENFIAVTDNPKSSLGKLATKKKIQIFQSQQGIPGRFSVLSAIGLLPAAIAEIKIEKILAGARKTSFFDAFLLACHQYLRYLENRNIIVFFPYSEYLGSFADWYIQLLAESIGKTKQIGITPIKAIGVKDQHSQLQLFLDGPDDKFFILLKPENTLNILNITNADYSLRDLFNAEYTSVKQTFIKRKKPFIAINLPTITPEIIGELFFLFELQIAFLGTLLKIDIDNQPAVELSKTLTRQILKTC